MLVLGGQRLDLGRDMGDALVELTPILGQIGDEMNDAQRQGIRGRSQDAWQGLTQGRKPLAYGDAALEKEASDLVGHARALADQA